MMGLPVQQTTDDPNAITLQGEDMRKLGSIVVTFEPGQLGPPKMGSQVLVQRTCVGVADEKAKK